MLEKRAVVMTAKEKEAADKAEKNAKKALADRAKAPVRVQPTEEKK